MKAKDVAFVRRVHSRASDSAELDPKVTGDLDSEDEWELGVVLK